MAVTTNKNKARARITGMAGVKKDPPKIFIDPAKMGFSKEEIEKILSILAESSNARVMATVDVVKLKGASPGQHQWLLSPKMYDSKIVSAVGYLGGKKELSIKSPVDTDQEYIGLIRKGIRKRSVEHLMQAANISIGEMAEIMEVTPKVFLALKPDDILEKSQSEKAVNIARLYAMGEEVFGSAGEFDKWMTGRVPSLGKKRPKDFLDTASGISLLMDELGRIQHGVYS